MSLASVAQSQRYQPDGPSRKRANLQQMQPISAKRRHPRKIPDIEIRKSVVQTLIQRQQSPKQGDDEEPLLSEDDDFPWIKKNTNSVLQSCSKIPAEIAAASI